MYFLKCPCLKGSFLLCVVIEVILLVVWVALGGSVDSLKLLVRLMVSPGVMLS